MELLNLYLGNTLIFDFFIVLFSGALLVHVVFKSKLKSSLIAGLLLAVLISAWEYTQEFMLHDFGFMFWLVLIAFWAYGSYKLLQQKGATKGIVFLVSALYFLFYLFMYPNMREAIDESFQTILFWTFIVSLIILGFIIFTWFYKKSVKYGSYLGKAAKGISERISKLVEQNRLELERTEDDIKRIRAERKREREIKKTNRKRERDKKRAEKDRKKRELKAAEERIKEYERQGKLREAEEKRRFIEQVSKEILHINEELEREERAEKKLEEENRIKFLYFKGLADEIVKGIRAEKRQEIGRLYQNLKIVGSQLLNTDYRLDVEQEMVKLNSLILNYKKYLNFMKEEEKRIIKEKEKIGKNFETFSRMSRELSDKIRRKDHVNVIESLFRRLEETEHLFYKTEHEGAVRSMLNSLKKEENKMLEHVDKLKNYFNRIRSRVNKTLHTNMVRERKDNIENGPWYRKWKEGIDRLEKIKKELKLYGIEVGVYRR